MWSAILGVSLWFEPEVAAIPWRCVQRIACRGTGERQNHYRLFWRARWRLKLPDTLPVRGGISYMIGITSYCLHTWYRLSRANARTTGF